MITTQISKLKSQIFLLLTLYCLLYSTPVFAIEEGGHGGESGMVWRIVNFAILALAVFLIVRYLKVKDFFADRRNSIRAELEEAKKAKEDAENKLKEFELKFSAIDKRIKEIYQEIRSEGEIEKKRIIEEAIRLSDRIQEQARAAAAQEIKKAREEIKGEIAKVAVEMAEEILRSELTAADHERLIKEYLEKVRLH